MKKQTVLVTGGAGFIGSHVIKKLCDRGHIVVAVDNFNKYYDPVLKELRVKVFLKGYKIPFYRYNIADFENLKKVFSNHKIDIVCHLAAQAGVRYSLRNPFIYEESNLKGTINLLELSKDFRVKTFIFASSSSVYGDNAKSPFKETDHTDKPISLYAATKKSTELFAYTYHKTYSLPCTGLRLFTVYGPWGRPDMAYFKFTKNILNDIPIEIYNHGKMERDFTYIDDVVEGITRSIEKTFPWEIINLSSGRPIKLLKFVNLLEKELGKKAKRIYLSRQKGDVLKTYGSIAKAEKLLNYKPDTSINLGIKNFVTWYLTNYR